jgi:hypothetical protein
MNPIQSPGIAEAVIKQRISEANHRRLARESRRRERPSKTAVQVPRRHSHLWSVVHFRHAYN